MCLSREGFLFFFFFFFFFFFLNFLGGGEVGLAL